MRVEKAVTKSACPQWPSVLLLEVWYFIRYTAFTECTALLCNLPYQTGGKVWFCSINT